MINKFFLLAFFMFIFLFSTKARCNTSLLIGDSLAVGMSNEFNEISKNNNLKPKIYAKNGTTISYWSTKIEDILEKEKPIIVFISLGTNDATSYDLNFEKRLNGFLETFNKKKIKYIWILPPNISEKKIKMINITRGIIKKNVSCFYEANLYHNPPPGDGIHMSNHGYIEMIRGAWKKQTGVKEES